MNDPFIVRRWHVLMGLGVHALTLAFLAGVLWTRLSYMEAELADAKRNHESVVRQLDDMNRQGLAVSNIILADITRRLERIEKKLDQ